MFECNVLRATVRIALQNIRMRKYWCLCSLNVSSYSMQWQRKHLYEAACSQTGSFVGTVDLWDHRVEEAPAAQLHVETDEPFLDPKIHLTNTVL